MSFFDPQQLSFFWALVYATVLGGFVGFEREYLGKAAGMRTNALIALGAAFFTILSLNAPVSASEAGSLWDPTRIAAQVVIGIGFLGAGVIIFQGSKVRGMTTAATMWVVAAIGMAVGAGFYLVALLVSLLTFIVLDVMARLKWHEQDKEGDSGSN